MLTACRRTQRRVGHPGGNLTDRAVGQFTVPQVSVAPRQTTVQTQMLLEQRVMTIVDGKDARYVRTM